MCHPLAPPESKGAVADSHTKFDAHVLTLPRRGAGNELQQLMDASRPRIGDATSRAWLTPEQFGKQ